MPDFLTAPFADGPHVQPLDLLIRQLLALLAGSMVAWVYCRTRKVDEIAPSFPTTLVLLSVLIAMVTQVIGDNVARAFSLVGALSIVRFRTVVRDTQDTAYVIFSVVVGMAIGARNPWVAFLGLAVVGVAAFVMRLRSGSIFETSPEYLLNLRVGIGVDPDAVIEQACHGQFKGRELLSVATGRDGLALNLTYVVRLATNISPDTLVKAMNKIDGVQSVEIERRGWDES
jgi:hypothetical protein